MPSAKNCYHSPLKQNELEESTIEEARDDYALASTKLQSRYKRFWLKYWAWFTHGALFCLSTMVFVLVIQKPIKLPEIYCKHWIVYMFEVAHSSLTTNPLAPANVPVEYNKELTTFNGTFDFDSIYRGEHSPELDAAWNRISQDSSIFFLFNREHMLD